jgi:hypothetical protein
VYFAQGATIQAGRFLATTHDFGNSVPANFYDAVKDAYNANKPIIAFDNWGLANDAKLEFKHSGTGSEVDNLWLIGAGELNDTAHTAEYAIGAWAPNQADGPNANADITLTGTAVDLLIGSKTKKVWLGNVKNDSSSSFSATYLFGEQVWVKSIISNGNISAVGGDGGAVPSDGVATVNWNDGVWVYGNKITPLAWPEGAGYDSDVILKGNDINISGHQIWISAKTQAAGNIELGDTPNNLARWVAPGFGINSLVSNDFGSNTFIIWALDIVAGGNVEANATGTVPATTPWIYGLNSVPKGKGGSIWVNSINAAGAIIADATYGIAVWNYNKATGDVVTTGDILNSNISVTDDNVLVRGTSNIAGLSNYKDGVYAADNGSESYYW